MSFLNSIIDAGTTVVNDMKDPIKYVQDGGWIGSLTRSREKPPSDNKYYTRHVNIATDASQVDAAGWGASTEGLGKIFGDYEQARRDYPDIPPLHGIAFPQAGEKYATNLPSVGGIGAGIEPVWQPFKPYDCAIHANGMLSKIVVHHWENGVPGMQQYFGSVAGEYMGVRGNFEESEFYIPVSDWLQHVSMLYETTQGVMKAIRFRTRGGLDSGWFGNRGLNGMVYEYECPVNKPAPQGGVEYYPIMALDVSTVNTDEMRAIAALFTYPYRINLDDETGQNNKKVKQVKTTAARSEPAHWARKWNYVNNSDVEQYVSLSETATIRTSHSVTHSKSESSSKNTSLSIGVSAMMEGVSLQRNETTSITNSRTSATSDTVTTEQTVTKFFEFPLKVPPRSTLEATVEINERRQVEEIRGGIEWDVPGVEVKPVTKFAFDYEGTKELDISIELDQTGGQVDKPAKPKTRRKGKR